MPDMNKWLGSTEPLVAWTGTEDRAYDTARFIAAKMSSIVIQRKTGNLAAQNMRIDPQEPTPRERNASNVTVSDMRVVVTGYKGHPTLTDTNLRRGDRFFHDGFMFTVTQILTGTPDRLEAIAEVGE